MKDIFHRSDIVQYVYQILITFKNFTAYALHMLKFVNFY